MTEHTITLADLQAAAADLRDLPDSTKVEYNRALRKFVARVAPPVRRTVTLMEREGRSQVSEIDEAYEVTTLRFAHDGTDAWRGTYEAAIIEAVGSARLADLAGVPLPAVVTDVVRGITYRFAGDILEYNREDNALIFVDGVQVGLDSITDFAI